MYLAKVLKLKGVLNYQYHVHIADQHSNKTTQKLPPSMTYEQNLKEVQHAIKGAERERSTYTQQEASYRSQQKQHIARVNATADAADNAARNRADKERSIAWLKSAERSIQNSIKKELEAQAKERAVKARAAKVSRGFCIMMFVD